MQRFYVELGKTETVVANYAHERVEPAELQD